MLPSPGRPSRARGLNWPRWYSSESSWCMTAAFILFSMENISNLQPPILYVFPSLPKPSNTTHTSKGKRPGNKYAKKKNHWKHKKEQNSEPPQSTAWVELSTKPRITYSSPESSPKLPSAALTSVWCRWRQTGPQTLGMLWDLLSSPEHARSRRVTSFRAWRDAGVHPTPFTFLIPDMKYVITQLTAPAGRNVGEESTFCTDWVLTQCILEKRRRSEHSHPGAAW